MGNKGQGDVRVDTYPTYPLSGQLVGSVSGTVYTFPDIPCTSIFLSAHPSNTLTAWVGNVSGTVTSNNGYPLNPSYSSVILFDGLSNLNQLHASFDKAGEKICWIVEVLE